MCRACDCRLSQGDDGLQVVDRLKFSGTDRDALRCENAQFTANDRLMIFSDVLALARQVRRI
jgi:hypothetical protein